MYNEWKYFNVIHQPKCLHFDSLPLHLKTKTTIDYCFCSNYFFGEAHAVPKSKQSQEKGSTIHSSGFNNLKPISHITYLCRFSIEVFKVQAISGTIGAKCKTFQDKIRLI